MPAEGAPSCLASFSGDHGVRIEHGPLARLTARTVVVLDAKDRVVYTQLVPEIGEEPAYEAALAAGRVAVDRLEDRDLVAADLASLAMELGDHETATKALGVVTVGRSESPTSRAEAEELPKQLGQGWNRAAALGSPAAGRGPRPPRTPRSRRRT